VEKNWNGNIISSNEKKHKEKGTTITIIFLESLQLYIYIYIYIFIYLCIYEGICMGYIIYMPAGPSVRVCYTLFRKKTAWMVRRGYQ